MVFAVLILCCAIFCRSRVVEPTGADTVVVGFFCLYALSGLISSDALSGLRFSLGCVVFIVAYLVYSRVFFLISVPRLCDLLLAPFLLFNIFSLVAYVLGLAAYNGGRMIANEISFGLMQDRGMPRMIGMTMNPDYFHLYCVLSIFYFLYGAQRAVCKVGLIISVVNITLTFSFGGYISVLGGLIVALFFGAGTNLLRLSGYLSVPASLAMFYLHEFLLEIYDARVDHASTGSGRFDLWETAILHIADDPLFGSGGFSFKEVAMAQHSIQNVHNTFLEIALDSGVVGFIFFVIANSFLLWKLSVTVSANNNARFIVPAYVSTLISMLSVSAIFYPPYILLLALSARIAYPARGGASFQDELNSRSSAIASDERAA